MNDINCLRGYGLNQSSSKILQRCARHTLKSNIFRATKIIGGSLRLFYLPALALFFESISFLPFKVLPYKIPTPKLEYTYLEPLNLEPIHSQTRLKHVFMLMIDKLRAENATDPQTPLRTTARDRCA